MEQFKYQQQESNIRLIYKLRAEEIDHVTMGMLRNNTISGIVSTVYQEDEGERFLTYDVSAKYSLEDFLSQVLGKERILAVLQGISDACLSVEEYMIPCSQLVLDLTYIFIDSDKQNISMVCVPVVNRENISLKNFFKNLMMMIQYDPDENCDYIAKILNFLNRTESMDLQAFQMLLKDLGQNEFKTDIESGTVILTQASAQFQKSMLIRVKTDERYHIAKPEYKIGKERQSVDLCIEDNPTLSRNHADILLVQGNYFLRDNHSTNHTYVDDELIVSGTTIQLSDNCKIRLGNEEFRFVLKK